MVRTSKKTTTPATDSNTITVADAATQLKTTEQALRLALIDIRPDDFDTVKALPTLDFEAVAKKLEQQQQPQLPAHSENLESSETATQQATDPATSEPQNAPIVPQASQQQLTNPQSPTPNNGLSLVEMVAKQAQEEIAALDGIAQVRNALILNNLAVRDAELAEGINQRWQGQKQGYVEVIRDLAGLAQSSPQFTPDTTDISAEIDNVLGKLNNVA